jgi:hypothetical protein
MTQNNEINKVFEKLKQTVNEFVGRDSATGLYPMTPVHLEIDKVQSEIREIVDKEIKDILGEGTIECANCNVSHVARLKEKDKEIERLKRENRNLKIIVEGLRCKHG